MSAVGTEHTIVAPSCPVIEPNVGETPLSVVVPDSETPVVGDDAPVAIKIGVTDVIPSCPEVSPQAGETPLEELTPEPTEGSTDDSNSNLKAVLTSIMQVLPSSPSVPDTQDGNLPVINPDASYTTIRDFLALAHSPEYKAMSVWHFAKLAEYLFGNFFLSLDIFCEHGANMLTDGKDSADLQAELRLGYVDVTRRVPESFFSWQRSSKSPEQDRLWNIMHDGVGPRIHVTRQDVNRACTFYCLIPIRCLTTIKLP